MLLAPASNAAKIPFAACPAASCLLYHDDPTVWLNVAIAASACWQPAGGPPGWAREGMEEGEGAEAVADAGALVASVGSAVDGDDPVGLSRAETGSGVDPPVGRAYARKAMRAAATAATEPTAVQLISLVFLGGSGIPAGTPERLPASGRGAGSGGIARVLGGKRPVPTEIAAGQVRRRRSRRRGMCRCASRAPRNAGFKVQCSNSHRPRPRLPLTPTDPRPTILRHNP